MDWVAKFQNTVGLNLTSYEEMVDKGMKQIQDELIKMNVEMKWYRYQITQLTSGAVSITFLSSRCGV
jgi:hypothetical protein